MTGPRWDRWPGDLGPGAPVYTVNELDIPAPLEAVWDALIDAERWPSSYDNARDVVVDGGGPLRPGARFAWTTLGVRVHTTVEVFEPCGALGWRGDTWYGRGLHTRLLVPTASGCRVVTEEAQAGLVPSIGRLVLRRQLLHWHQRWLEGLARAASAGT